MIEALKKIESEAQQELSEATDPKHLEALKIKYLGRKGLFASLSGNISGLSAEERRAAGQEMNRVKQALESLFSSRES